MPETKYSQIIRFLVDAVKDFYLADEELDKSDTFYDHYYRYDHDYYDRLDNELNVKDIDPQLTPEQRKRDKLTTALYEQFVESHKEKKEFAKKTKESIRKWCFWWVNGLTIVCVFLVFYVICCSPKTTSDIVALVVALVGLVGAVVGTLNIVTKHVFPENEEKNITEIVKAIQDNDLKDKQENLKQKEQDKNQKEEDKANI